MNHRTVTIFALGAMICTAAAVYLTREPPSTRRIAEPREAPERAEARTTPSAAVALPEQIAEPLSSSDNQAAAIEDEAVLNFRSEADLQRFRAAAAKAGFQVLATNRALLSLRIRITAAERSRLRALAGDDAVIESNYTVLIPFPVQPDEHYTGTPFDASALSFIGAEQNDLSWGKGVTVAILDTGVGAHPTLDGVSIEHVDLTDSGGADEAYHAYHGTAVASLIAGRDGNGVAPGVELLSIRVLDSDGIGDSFTLAQGIVEAVDRGADVINLSVGSFGYSQTLANAVDYAATRGVVLVASSGNEGASVLPFPAQFDSVLAVSAIDGAGKHAPFSNRGAEVDLAAPGVGVFAAADEVPWIRFTGTSAAAPFVAGSIAAIMSQDRRLSATEAAKRLSAHAGDTGPPGPDELTGAGVIDLSRALRPPGARETDLALADIYLPPSGDAAIITAQNRGTESIASATLVYLTNDGLPQTINLGPLSPGQVASHSLPLPNFVSTRDKEFQISAAVSAGQAGADDRPGNDRRAISIPTVSPEAEPSP